MQVRVTTMKPVMVACRALLGLSVLTVTLPAGALAQTQPAAAPVTAPAQPPAATASPPAAAPRQAQPAAAKPRGPAPPRAGERRRPSYASCNREAHRRNLRGGSRRRFLIRCKLGYDRPRQPPASQPLPSPARQP